MEILDVTFYNFFTTFVTNKVLKTLYTQRKLFKYYTFINMYIVFVDRVFAIYKFTIFNFKIVKCYTRNSVVVGPTHANGRLSIPTSQNPLVVNAII